jgi:signal transduction histidine kinase
VSGLVARLTPWTWALLAFAVLAAGVGAEWAGGLAMPEAVGDFVAGMALVGGGAAAWATRPSSRSGSLSVLAGLAWFAGDLAEVLVYAHRGPLVHLLLTYPSGRAQSRLPAVVIGAAYVDGLVPELARSEWPTIALMAAVVIVAVRRHGAAGGVERRARAAALAGAVAVGGTLALAAVARLAGADLDGAAVWVYEVAVALTALGLAADLLWGGWTRAAVTGLVVDLGDRYEPQALRAALARTVGDPDLQVAYRVGGGSAWVDEAGRPVRLPELEGPDRTVTLLRDEGAPVAALVHDPAALGDPELMSSMTAAARLAIANVRLQADVAVRVREVAASRRRLVEAGDRERQRLGEELRDGAERRLAAVSARLTRLATVRNPEAASTVAQLAAELDSARTDLTRFAQGIHPWALTDGGLHGALAELSAQAAVPVTLDVTDSRFPPAHEAAAFFVCSEGLTNVAKHASTARVAIAVRALGSTLTVEVADDGAGGANPCGSGLRGLADRVEALGGALRIASHPGAGTRLEAELPISEAGA